MHSEPTLVSSQPPATPAPGRPDNPLLDSESTYTFNPTMGRQETQSMSIQCQLGLHSDNLLHPYPIK